MSQEPLKQTGMPSYVADLTPGAPYELSNGRAIECLPAGGRHSRSNAVGTIAVETDPAVESAGVDTGYAFSAKDLRAPDIAVGNVPEEAGWVRGVPPLAIEYADTGQDETELQQKITDLLQAGTRYIWVVRLHGPRRVEVYEPNRPCRILTVGQQLEAPGVLQNPLPMEALYDRNAAHEAALRNLLQRRGYENLDAVFEEGREEGFEKGIEKGRTEGLEKGLMKTARNMLAEGVEDNLILKVTGLSPETLAALKR